MSKEGWETTVFANNAYRVTMMPKESPHLVLQAFEYAVECYDKIPSLGLYEHNWWDSMVTYAYPVFPASIVELLKKTCACDVTQYGTRNIGREHFTPEVMRCVHQAAEDHCVCCYCQAHVRNFSVPWPSKADLR